MVVVGVGPGMMTARDFRVPGCGGGDSRHVGELGICRRGRGRSGRAGDIEQLRVPVQYGATPHPKNRCTVLQTVLWWGTPLLLTVSCHVIQIFGFVSKNESL